MATLRPLLAAAGNFVTSLLIFPLLILTTCVTPGQTFAQITDGFEDGDFTSEPVWTGTVDRWRIVEVDGNRMLNSAGRASADTLYLATASETAYGTWEFRLRRSGVNLSNFNGVRIFLVSDSPNLAGRLRGYYLQIGTNNANDIRLFRLDGDPARRRVEIGRSEPGITAGSSADVRLRIQRDEHHRWMVEMDGDTILTTEDDRYQASQWFGFWVKHASATADGYFFDDVRVRPGTAPPPPPTEATAEATGPQTIRVDFSEPARAATACMPVHYTLTPEIGVAGVACESADVLQTVVLHLDRRLEARPYDLAIEGVVHQSGVPLATLRTVVDVKEDQVREFTAMDVRFDHRAAHRLSVRFNRAVEAGSVQPGGFAISTASVIVMDARVTSPNVVELTLDAPPPAGHHALIVDDIWSNDGQSWRGTVDFYVTPLPRPGDLVINEIHFDPPDQRLEFIEIYNRSEIEYDLAHLDFSDDRLQATPVTEDTWMLPAGGFVTIVVDSIEFRNVFPDVPNIRQPSVWHTLNNAGDAVILYADTTTIDAVVFTASWTSNERSIERIDPDGPSTRHNFAPSVDLKGATPGVVNSVFAPVTQAPKLVAAEEIKAANPEGGLVALHFDRPIDLSAASPVVRVAGTMADSLELVADTVVVARHHAARPFDVGLSGIVDVFGLGVRDTVAAVALLAHAGELVFNEIMFAPRADPFDNLPDQPEYIEIFNTIPHKLTVSHILIADEADENDAIRAITFNEPLKTLAPEGYLVVAAEPAGSTSASDIRLIEGAFPTTNFHDPSITLMVSRRNSLNLSNTGKTIRLLRADSLEINRVSYHPDFHHRGVESHVGYALERIDTAVPADSEHNWTTSVAAEGGTPGRANSVVSGARVSGGPGIEIEPKVFSPDAGDPPGHASINYALRTSSANVRLHIFDSRGRLVRRIDPATLSGETGSLLWDGRDDDGRRLRIGMYVVLLEAIDLDSGSTESYRGVVVLARPLG